MGPNPGRTEPSARAPVFHPHRGTCLRGIIAALSVAAALLAVPQAHAATITPNTFVDDNTGNGNCTLREAIRAANANAAVDACPAGSGADIIALAVGRYALSVGPAGDQVAATGDLDVTDPAGLTIAGNPSGSTVDGGGIDRVFQVLGPATASFDLLTITGGANGGAGGAIETSGVGGGSTVTRSTITGNSSVTGGGLDVVGNMTLAVTDTTVAGNVAPGVMGEGGGINAETGAVLNVINSTISGNSATADGGAIHVVGLTKPTVNVLSSTIAANTAANGGGTLPEAGNTVNLKGSILGGNTGTVSGPDCAGALNSQGNNLIESTSGCSISNVQPTDIVGQDPQLGPLASNGGPTLTQALGPTSPAIDKGNAFGLSTDQRGVQRSIDFPSIPNAAGGDGSDIGAFELQPDNAIKLGKLKRNQNNGTAKQIVLVPLPDAGTLTIKGKGLKTKTTSVHDNGKVKLKVIPKGSKKGQLNSSGVAKIKAKITYTPTGNATKTLKRKLKLLKR